MDELVTSQEVSRATGDMQQQGTKQRKFRQDWGGSKGPGPGQSQAAPRTAPGNCFNFHQHKKFYWTVLLRASHASESAGGLVNTQVLIQWIWSGAWVFTFLPGAQLMVMLLVQGWHFENHWATHQTWPMTLGELFMVCLQRTQPQHRLGSPPSHKQMQKVSTHW